MCRKGCFVDGSHRRLPSWTGCIHGFTGVATLIATCMLQVYRSVSVMCMCMYVYMYVYVFVN